LERERPDRKETIYIHPRARWLWMRGRKNSRQMPLEEMQKMIKKILMIFGFSILLTSCKFSPVNRIVDYQNPKSELIKTLLTEQELSEISRELHWEDVIINQDQNILDPITSVYYEEAQSSYFGDFQNSDHSTMIFHTVDKYDSPIDKNKPTNFLFGGILKPGNATSYIPEISASGDVAAKCMMQMDNLRQICDVHIKYQYIETGINITTHDIEREIMAGWLNAIIAIVEPRILSQDTMQ
jgi:hypothetical protein